MDKNALMFAAATALVMKTAGASRVSSLLKDAVFLGAALVCWKVFKREGRAGLLRVIAQTFRLIPGVNKVVGKILQGEVKGAMKTLVPGGDAAAGGGNSSEEQCKVLEIPEKAIDRASIVEEIRSNTNADGSYCHDGKAFALVYYNDEGRFKGHSEMNADVFASLQTLPNEGLGPDREKMLRQVFKVTSHGNALNPLMFPSLRKYETECIAMVAWMLNGDSRTVGAMTSGGTESILMAIKSFKEMALEQRPHVLEPELIAPITIHPAHEKGGHYFGVKIVHCRVDPVTKRADMEHLESLINENTIGIAVSAPQYCHCVVDPVAEAGQLALKHNLPLHVDACYGGFALPWIERLGYKVPEWDFRVPGVTTISADLHKGGFCPKGASFIMFRDDSVRRHMYYAYSEWPGGLYVSPTMAGTRPGANIAMAWATLKTMGQDGYLSEARAVMDTCERMKAGVQSVEGLKLVVETQMCGFAFHSTDPSVHIFALADEMEKANGWKMERQSNPDSLHCSIMPAHANQNMAEAFCRDVASAFATVKSSGKTSKEGTAAIYGMVGNIPDKTIVDDFLKGFFSEIYKHK